MRRAGQGRSSGAVRSATQKRVRSWWSRAVDSGLETSEWSTEARMSSISMAEGEMHNYLGFGVLGDNDMRQVGGNGGAEAEEISRCLRHP